MVPSLSAKKSNISFGKVVPRVWEMSEIPQRAPRFITNKFYNLPDLLYWNRALEIVSWQLVSLV